MTYCIQRNYSEIGGTAALAEEKARFEQQGIPVAVRDGIKLVLTGRRFTSLNACLREVEKCNQADEKAGIPRTFCVRKVIAGKMD